MSENHHPFDMSDPYDKDRLEPGFYDRVLIKDHMYKEITPFEIKTSIHLCFACDQKSYQKPLELSNFNASVMVIGETPSDVDFQTPEGKLLADTLTWAQYDLNDVYFTSLIKCEESKSPDRCQHHLLSEILCVQPKIIIALGYDIGMHFDPNISSPGYLTHLLDRHYMITTYRTCYAMSDQKLFQDFCQHILQAKTHMGNISQRSIMTT